MESARRNQHVVGSKPLDFAYRESEPMRPLLTLVAVFGLTVILAEAQDPSESRPSSKTGDQKAASEAAHRFVHLESNSLTSQWN
jgi:hypothetical protein